MQSEIEEITDTLGDGRIPPSPTSPKRTYIVQSPSRDLHDDKASINSHPTPVQSPTHPSHSRNSSESRVSRSFSFSLIGKNPVQFRKKKKKKKGWPLLFRAIDEEDEAYGGDDFDDEDDDNDGEYKIRRRVVLLLMGFVIVFLGACLVIWGASRPYRLQVQMKSWKLNNFYYGEGSDYTGVPTKFLTLNSSVKMNIKNPATFFGIHVSSRSLNLYYSQLKVGSGEFVSYYQPKRSEMTISVNVEGQKVPLYGVGEDLIMSNNNGSVPLKLEFEIRSQAYLMGPLLKTSYHRQILCIMKIDSKSRKIFDFEKDSCYYG